MTGAFGNYVGSCVACMRGTDTGLAFRGEIEFIAAALMMLGVPENQAISIVKTSDAILIDGENRFVATMRVCAGCAERARVPVKPVLLIDGADVPVLGR